jgi:hypothetical protein
MAYDQGRVALAEFNERAEDLVAEARAEMEHENGAAGSPSTKRRSGPSEHKAEH